MKPLDLPALPQSPTSQPGVVAAVVYCRGVRQCETTIGEAGAWSRKPGHLVWIGLCEPKEALLRDVQRQFGLHELAVEDALHAHQRPKVEIFGDTLFMVLHTAGLSDGRIMLGETHIFVGRGFVLTVRHGASASYGAVRARVEASPRLLGQGEDFILYAIMDFVVDGYFPVLDRLDAEVEQMDDRLLRRLPTEREIERIHRVRRDLEKIRRAAGPLIEICRRLEHHDLPNIDPEIRPYYRDVHDHVIRVNDTIDSLRELISFAFESSLMLASARQNDVTRKLAAWAAILAVPTAIAGIYGMNFEHMPELAWKYGYYAVLGVIAMVCAVLYLRFRRTGWL